MTQVCPQALHSKVLRTHLRHVLFRRHSRNVPAVVSDAAPTSCGRYPRPPRVWSETANFPDRRRAARALARRRLRLRSASSSLRIRFRSARGTLWLPIVVIRRRVRSSSVNFSCLPRRSLRTCGACGSHSPPWPRLRRQAVQPSRRPSDLRSSCWCAERVLCQPQSLRYQSRSSVSGWMW